MLYASVCPNTWGAHTWALPLPQEMATFRSNSVHYGDPVKRQVRRSAQGAGLKSQIRGSDQKYLPELELLNSQIRVSAINQHLLDSS
jgi:predicted 2-oxoglutarate/Fe(II)-dependent dioxygenase YbiX